MEAIEPPIRCKHWHRSDYFKICL